MQVQRPRVPWNRGGARWIAALLSVIPILSGCGQSASPSSNGALRLPMIAAGNDLDPGVLTPSRFSAVTPLFIATMLQAGLVKFGPDLHVIPDLAVSFPTISPGGRTYTFTIRQDARFSNGQQCTAADVAESWARALRDRYRSPLVWQDLGNIAGAGQVASGIAYRLSGVRVIRRLTLRIHLVRPDATFLQKLAFPVAAVEGQGEPTGELGLGPWQISRRTSDRSYVLRPRPYYYGGAMTIRSIVLVPARTSGQALQLYRKGAIDAAPVPSDLVASMESRPDFRSSGSLDAYYAMPPPGTGVSLARKLDRSVLDRRLAPSLVPLSTLVPPSVPDYVSSAPSMTAGSDPAVAVGKVLPDTPWSTTEIGLVHALNGLWSYRNGGVRVPVVHRSFLLPDPGRWISVALSQTSSAWLRRSLQRAQSLTEDPVSRMNDYGDLEGWVLSQGYVIPLASGTVDFLLKSRVQSLQITPLGLMPENNSWPLVNVS